MRIHNLATSAGEIQPSILRQVNSYLEVKGFDQNASQITWDAIGRMYGFLVGDNAEDREINIFVSRFRIDIERKHLEYEITGYATTIDGKRRGSICAVYCDMAFKDFDRKRDSSGEYVSPEYKHGMTTHT